MANELDGELDNAEQEKDWPHLEPAQEFLSVGVSETQFLGDREQAGKQFARTKAIHFRNLLDPGFLATNLRLAETGGFVKGGEAGPEVEAPQRVNRLLDVAFQRSTMLRWMEEVTGCEPLQTFGGRLTQTRASTGQQRMWHDDLQEDSRWRLALVINLSGTPFKGGAFELRKKTGEKVFRHEYSEVNEAVLFLVDRALQHRVLPVLSGGPRRVFAGWALAR